MVQSTTQDIVINAPPETEYFICDAPGHAEQGMFGTLNVESRICINIRRCQRLWLAQGRRRCCPGDQRQLIVRVSSPVPTTLDVTSTPSLRHSIA